MIMVVVLFNYVLKVVIEEIKKVENLDYEKLFCDVKKVINIITIMLHV